MPLRRSTENDDNPRRDLERQLAGLLRLVKWAVAGFLLLVLATCTLGFSQRAQQLTRT